MKKLQDIQEHYYFIMYEYNNNLSEKLPVIDDTYCFLHILSHSCL